MARYINDKSKRRPQDKLTEDRYQYLTVDQAEPNLGDPVFPGDTPPFGTQYITVSIEGYPGERYWIPNQGGIIPGSITIYDENVLVGGVSSTTQLNFIGAAISASSNLSFKETTLTLRDSETFSFNVGLAVTQSNSNASGVVKYSTTNLGIVTITNVTGSFTTNVEDELYQDNVGIAKTPLSATSVINASVASNIEVSPEYFSSDKQLIFNNNDEFDGAVGFIYQNNGATESNVGLASVGIGTTLARRTLHVDGDIKLTGSIEDYNNSLGNTSDILVKNSSGGIEWIEQNSLNIGAAGTYYEVQFHSGTGTLAGADKLVYRSDLNGGQIGIGTTNPSKLLDVEGDSIFVGDVTFDGDTTDYDALWDRSENAFIVKDSAKFAAGTGQDLKLYHDATSSYITNNTGHLYIQNTSTNHNNFIYLKNGSKNLIVGAGGGDNWSVSLYHNNALRLNTTSAGINVTGTTTDDGATHDGDVTFKGNTTNYDALWDKSENSFIVKDNAQFRVGSGGDVKIYHDGSNTYIEPSSNGVGDLIVGSATTDIAKFVYDGGVSLYYQDVLKFDTIGAGVTVYGTAVLPQINTVGVATFDNVRIGYDNDGTIDTSSGNLILDSNAGTVQVDDILFVNSTTQSDNKDSGSIYTQGGVGVEKNLNVGGSVGIASTAESTSKDTGALIVEGGVGIEKNLNVGGSVKVTGIATITEKFYIGSGNTGITTILDEDDMVSDSDTALATQQSIKKYVDDQITAEDLDFSGDTGTGQVDLDSQTLAIQGTTNQIKTSASGQTLTIGFDDNVTINYLTSTNIKATGITTLGVTTLTDVTVQQLDVSGITTLGITTLTDTTSQQLFVSGISTLGNVFIQPVGTGASVGEKEPGVSGVVTFYGDGSGLRNVVAIGTGIDIQNSGTSVGSASTINFGDNLTGSLDAGVYTINAADAPDPDTTRSIFSHYSDYASHSETSHASFSLVGIGSTTYTEVSAIQADTPSGGDDFGTTITCSADGKTIIVGAPGHDASVANVGAVYVFDRVGNTYSQVGFFTGSEATNQGAYFGTSVACSADGKTIVVGNHEDNLSELGVLSGIVYVFDREGDTFNQVGILTGSFASDDYDYFGYSVACSADGKTIIVGAYQDEIDSNVPSAGVVYVYDREGNNFNEVGILTASDQGQADYFGTSVECSADGKTIVAGATGHDGSSNGVSSRGAVYVFDRAGNDFNEVGILTSSNSTDFYSFGRELEISADGKTIIASSYSPSGNVGDRKGSATVFDRVGNDFNEVGILTGGSYADIGDNFGSTLAISADGKTIVVGAHNDEIDPSITSSGLVHVFNRQGNNFNRVGVLTGSYAVAQNDIFGTSVAISADGKSIIASARLDEIGSPSNGGVVYVFDQDINDTPLIRVGTDNELFIDGPISIADTTSNAGGARYISTEAPTAAVGTDGDIWYDISSTGNVFGTGGNIPVGGIIMWYGTIANIPASWALCDGTSYSTAVGTIVTPDLRDRFVVGAATTVTVNSTDYPGTNITGTGTTTGGSKDAVLVSHTHDLETGWAFADGGNNPTVLDQNLDPVNTQTTSSFTSTEGESGTNKNLPPYYALAYIMRVS